MTTSPIDTPQTQAEIEAVFGDGDPGERALAGAAPSMAGEWRRYRAFLTRPRLLPRGPQMDGAWRAGARMLVLDMALMAVFIAGLFLASALGFEPPDNVNNSLEPGIATILFVVLIAPVLEELVFRSWLSGKAAIIAFVLLALIGFALLPFIASGLEANAWRLGIGGFGLAIGLILAPLAAFFLLRRPVSPLFARLFPVLFWASTLGFALIHLGNYAEASWEMLGILLPLVLPQFALGTMLGYLRVHYGLAPAIALHSAHNAILFSLAIVGGLGGDSAQASAAELVSMGAGVPA